MPIRVSCACGKLLTVKEEHAGKRTKCPGCGQFIMIPALGVPRLPSEDLELGLGEAPAEPLHCPSCQEIFSQAERVCVKCQVDLRTGLPVGEAAQPRRGDRVLRTSAAVEPGEMGFARLVLYAVIKPASTMESLLFMLGRPDMLVKMTLFYLGSLIVVAAMAAFGITDWVGGGASGSLPVSTPSVDAAGEDIPTFAKMVGQDLGRVTFDFEMDPSPPQEGKAVEMSYRITNSADHTPWTKRLTGTINLERADLQGGSGHVAFDGELLPVSPGDYRCSANIGPSGTYRVALDFEGPQDQPDIFFAHRIVVPEKVSRTAEKAIRRAPVAITMIFAALVLTLIGLLIDSITLSVGVRLFGGGGGFVAMLAVMAFLSGIVNLLKIVVVGVQLTAGPHAARYVDLAFWVWNYVLYMLALMKVYELEFMAALAANIVAGILRMWLGAIILVGVYGVLGIAM